MPVSCHLVAASPLHCQQDIFIFHSPTCALFLWALVATSQVIPNSKSSTPSISLLLRTTICRGRSARALAEGGAALFPSDFLMQGPAAAAAQPPSQPRLLLIPPLFLLSFETRVRLGF